LFSLIAQSMCHSRKADKMSVIGHTAQVYAGESLTERNVVVHYPEPTVFG